MPERAKELVGSVQDDLSARSKSKALQTPAASRGLRARLRPDSETKKSPGLLRIAFCLLFFSVIPSDAQHSTGSIPRLFENRPKVEAPVVLCIDDKPTAGGQPSNSAYAKAAANGFRSVLTLRAPADGVDVNRERFMVERTSMRYFNIPFSGKLPGRQQVDRFLAVGRDPQNHPMLVNCAFAERVAPFMMIFRMQEQNWSQQRALEEAASSGLKKEVLERFAREYFTAAKKPG